MSKIQVITQKELVKPALLKQSTVAVVDIFIATSSIALLLDKGYGPVYPANDRDHALKIYERIKDDKAILLGEKNGRQIEGFLYPEVTNFEITKRMIPAIFCSTNGTRAIEKSKEAKHLLLSSLINGHQVAKHLYKLAGGNSIVIVCSGNAGHFSREDVVGAGQLVDHLLQFGEFSLSDSAKASHELYLSSRKHHFQDLLEGDTFRFFKGSRFKKSIIDVLDSFEKVDVVPYYQHGKIISLNEKG